MSNAAPSIDSRLASTPAMRIFRRRDLVEWGINPEAVRSNLRSGEWSRLHHGVYVVTAALTDAARDPTDLHLLLAEAATVALPQPAFSFAATGALAHRLPLQRVPTEITLVRPLTTDQRSLRRRISTPSALLPVTVRRHNLTVTDTLLVGGLPTVAAEVAAVTAAAQSTPEWAVAILDAVSWQKPDQIRVLARVTEEWPRLPGIGTVRRALPFVRSGAQSPLESISRFRIVNAGVPEPRLQVRFDDAMGLIGYADMTWDDARVIGECDGLSKYEDRETLIREKLREDRLRALGFIVVRWTWREIVDAPGSVLARLRSALTQGVARTGQVR